MHLIMCTTGPLFLKHNILNIYDTYKPNYSTRNAQDYIIIKMNKSSSLCDHVIRNCGPLILKNITGQDQCTKTFKDKLKSNLLSKYY